MRPMRLLALMAGLACRGTKDPAPSEPTPPEPTPRAEEVPVEDPEPPPPPASPTGGPTVELDGATELSRFGSRSLQVTVGERLAVRFSEHGSVGETAEVRVADPAVAAVVDRRVAHRHPEKLKAGMTGADAAVGAVFLEARAPGTTEVILEERFRGRVQEATTWTLTVAAE